MIRLFAAWLVGAVGLDLVAIGAGALIVIPERIAGVAWLVVIAGLWCLLLAWQLVDEAAHRQQEADPS